MRAPLGVKLLLHDRGRAAFAAAGIAAAVLIALVEMGFMNGVVDSHLRIVEAARGDLVLLDAKRTHLNKWEDMLPIRAPQLAAIDGVASVAPVYQAGKTLRAAPRESEHRIVVFAFSPDDPPLDLGWSAETLALLRRPGTVLMDRLSRSIYGDLRAGQDVWLEGRRMRLGGFVSLGPTIVVDGEMFMSEATYRELEVGDGPSMAVVRLAPGADPARVRAAIEARTGGEVAVYTKPALAARESAYLMRVAPLGLLFGAGMAAGLFVGLVICYQVLYVAVRRRLEAYATLKAMGFGNGFVLRTVLEQAWGLALAGLAAGVAAAAVAYRAIAAHTGLLVELTPGRIGAVAAACLAACTAAGALAAWRAMRSAPAELF
jgi:putative ABC transport system permease protein